MTDQELNSSNEPASPSSTTVRFTLVAALGITGTVEDCERFRDLMIEDFQRRCAKAADKVFSGRIQLLPLEESLPSGEVQ